MVEDFEPGSLLGERFRLIRKLGSGAVGNVWLAHDAVLHEEPVACKVLNPATSGDPRAIADLKREVLLTRKLRHPNIVSIHSFWEIQDTRFITMEYAEGINLAHLLSARGQPLTLAEILPWVEKICQALDYAHGEAILHRDVKPANIIVTKDARVFLADFGIARTAREARLRMKGQFTSGTLLFMSPEQLMGREVDCRTDLYSLACSIYELLNGTPPFYRGSIVSQIRSRRPAPIPYYGEAVNRIILKALHKDPNQRFPSCGVFFEALARAAGFVPTTTSLPPLSPADLARPSGAVDPNAETVTLPTARMPDATKPLGALLMDAGLITEEQLVEALLKHDATRERLGAVLVRLGYVAPESVTEALKGQLRIKSLPLSTVKFDSDLVNMVPANVARELLCVPVRREGQRIVMAMADPLDFEAVNFLETECGATIEPRIATEADILAAIDRAYGPGEARDDLRERT